MRINSRRGERELRDDMRTKLHVLDCDSCGELFHTGLGGTPAVSGGDVVVAAHACGWDVSNLDAPVCPECRSNKK